MKSSSDRTFAKIPAEISRLFEEYGKTIVLIEDITAHQSLSPKKAYRVCFSDGSLAKARLLVGDQHAGLWDQLRTQVGSMPFLCDCLLQNGRAVLEEWVEGEVLQMSCSNENIARSSGRVLAQFQALWEESRNSLSRTSEPEQEMVCSRFESLVFHGGMLRSEADVLCAAALKLAPARVRLCLVHHDFCGENLVLHKERGIVSIDHEWMQIGAPDLDLARAMQRWSLTEIFRAAFLEGYWEAEGPGDLEYENFWIVFSELHDAEALVRTKRADADRAVSALRNRLSER